MGFFDVQDFDVLPLASADNQAQLAELDKTLATEFNVSDYSFLK